MAGPFDSLANVIGSAVKVPESMIVDKLVSRGVPPKEAAELAKQPWVQKFAVDKVMGKTLPKALTEMGPKDVARFQATAQERGIPFSAVAQNAVMGTPLPREAQFQSGRGAAAVGNVMAGLPPAAGSSVGKPIEQTPFGWAFPSKNATSLGSGGGLSPELSTQGFAFDLASRKLALPLSDKDINAAVKATFGEAAREGPIGQKAVAATMLNRADAQGTSVAEQVYAPHQYEAVITAAGKQRIANASPEQLASVKDNILPILNRTEPDPTGGAVSYLNPKAQTARGDAIPGWAQGDSQRIGNHVFYKDVAPYTVPAQPKLGTPEMVNALPPGGGITDRFDMGSLPPTPPPTAPVAAPPPQVVAPPQVIAPPLPLQKPTPSPNAAGGFGLAAPIPPPMPGRNPGLPQAPSPKAPPWVPTPVTPELKARIQAIPADRPSPAAPPPSVPGRNPLRTLVPPTVTGTVGGARQAPSAYGTAKIDVPPTLPVRNPLAAAVPPSALPPIPTRRPAPPAPPMPTPRPATPFSATGQVGAMNGGLPPAPAYGQANIAPPMPGRNPLRDMSLLMASGTIGMRGAMPSATGSAAFGPMTATGQIGAMNGGLPPAPAFGQAKFGSQLGGRTGMGAPLQYGRAPAMGVPPSLQRFSTAPMSRIPTAPIMSPRPTAPIMSPIPPGFFAQSSRAPGTGVSLGGRSGMGAAINYGSLFPASRTPIQPPTISRPGAGAPPPGLRAPSLSSPGYTRPSMEGTNRLGATFGGGYSPFSGRIGGSIPGGGGLSSQRSQAAAGMSMSPTTAGLHAAANAYMRGAIALHQASNRVSAGFLTNRRHGWANYAAHDPMNKSSPPLMPMGYGPAGYGYL